MVSRLYEHHFVMHQDPSGAFTITHEVLGKGVRIVVLWFEADCARGLTKRSQLSFDWIEWTTF